MICKALCWAATGEEIYHNDMYQPLTRLRLVESRTYINNKTIVEFGKSASGKYFDIRNCEVFPQECIRARL